MSEYLFTKVCVFRLMLIYHRFDLTPACVFANHMPQAFVTSYVHWYDHHIGEIVFRPRNNPWDLADVNHWHLRRHGTSWRLHQSSRTLINMKSKDAQMILSLLKSVEDKPHIHISHNTISHSVEIEVPRLKLDFSIDSGDDQVQSRQYRGMNLDDDQRVGTLIGLTSKLVLRRAKIANDRLVLIPEGALSYRKTLSHHVSVSISRQENTTVHAYHLDPTLGRVLDNGAMQSKLLLCFLHALTSHWLPDPLTRYTGTEAALTILRSSAVRSFDKLCPENVTLLNKIATLSPPRAFYPPSERVMQQIGWDTSLSFQAQHGDFQALVKEIFSHEKKMSLFHFKDVFEDLSRSDTAWMSAINPDLHERAAIRAATFQIAGFGAERFKTSIDQAYEARDRQANSERGRRAFATASMLVREQAFLDQPISKFTVCQDHFHDAEVKGSITTQDPPVISYDSKWLSSPSPLLQDLWCTLHYSLTTKSTISNEFDVLIWLATMAYATQADMNVIRAFVAFYRMSHLTSCPIPTKPLFRLSQGSTFILSQVQHAAENTARSYKNSSEAQLPKQGSETDNEHLKRIEQRFQTQKDMAVQTFAATLQTQWPCEKPDTPSSQHMNKYLDPASAMNRVRPLFQSWYDNQTFEQYMKTLSSMIQCLPAAPITRPRLDVLMPPKKTKSVVERRYCHPVMIFAADPPGIACNTSELAKCSVLLTPQEPKLAVIPELRAATETEAKDRLDQFCQTLSACAKTTCEQSYVDYLRTSCGSLHKHQDETEVQSFLVDDDARESLRQYLSACENYLTNFSRRLKDVLEGGSTRSNAIASSIQVSPRLSPSFWLSQLNRDRYSSLPASWQAAMVEFGLAITNLQRAQRLVVLLDKPVELNEELQHIGHTNWSPRNSPETLLLEAESGIMVRKVQAMIAAEMMHPRGAQNTVIQLNMGEGKSSTIVPIVAAALADSRK